MTPMAENVPLIHPTAIVDSSAELDSSVRVGPYAIIGAGVQMGAQCEVAAHCIIEGPSTIGSGNTFHPFGRIGGSPQDKKYAGEDTRLVVGNDNMFREYVTLNRGTVQDRGETTLGDDNWIMAYVHVAHDCIVGSHTILANTTNLAGHVQIGDWVILGGYTGVHQFCKVGAHAMTGVGSVVLHDLPPYVMASGDSANAHGLNSEGLKRRGFGKERISLLRKAYKLLYRSGLSFEEARTAIAALVAPGTDSPQESANDIALLNDFLATATRGIVR